MEKKEITLQSNAEEQEKYQRLRGLEKGMQAKQARDKKIEQGMVGEIVNENDKIAQELGLLEEGLTDELMAVGNAKEEKQLKLEIEGIKNELGEEKTKKLANEAFKRMLDFYRMRKKIISGIQRLKENKDCLIRAIHEDVSLKESAGSWGKVNECDLLIKAAEKKLEQAVLSSPESFLTNYLLVIREWKNNFEKYNIIETDGVREMSDRIMSDVKKKMEKTNGVSALLGPTGSGKTVMAKKIAEELSSPTTKEGEVSYYFVSAHSKMGPEDLMYRMGITVESVPAEDAPKIIKEKKQAYKQEHPDVSPADLEEAYKIIEEVVRRQSSEKGFQTKTIMESVARAAEEGKIVVIDEFNYLPAETLASLNNLTSTTPGKSGQITVGDKVRQIKVKEGFGVIFTGNVGEEYIGRQEKFDPAFARRILNGAVKYSYPPQEIRGTLKSSIISEKAVDGQEPPERDLYQVAMVQALDMNGNLEGPDSLPDDLWRLAQTFGLIQKISSGKDIHDLGFSAKELSYFQGITKFKFETIFLSFSSLNSIVREWKLDNFDHSLDAYIYQNVIRPAEVINKKEAAQLLFLFRWGDFLNDRGWEDMKVDSINWDRGINDIDKMSAVAEKDKTLTERKVFTPKEIVEPIFGLRIPPYSTMEERQSEKERLVREQDIQEIDEWMESETKEAEKEGRLLEVCETE